MIGEFKVWNLRSYPRARFDFSAPRLLLVGPNGSGKSNLLEAIAFLGLLRSFRTTRIGEMIRAGENGFAVGGVWRGAAGGPDLLEARWSREGRRSLFVNHTPVAAGRDFIQFFHPVVFAPEDIALIAGAPGERRRFIDMLCSQIDPGYLNVLHDYHHALKQRNAALRRPRVDIRTLEAYENLLSFAGADLTRRRRDRLNELNRELAELSGHASEEQISVEYRPQCDGSAQDHLELFARMRPREAERHTSLCGCHLDDFRIRRGGRVMRGFASNGQNRLAALFLKLGAAALLKNGCGKENLVILVDDVTGELDHRHRAIFLERIADAGQMFFTVTAPPDDDFFRDAVRLELPPEAAVKQ